MSSPVKATSSANDSGRRVPSRVPPPAASKSPLDLGQPEAGGVGRDDEVAGEDQFEATADRSAVDGGDHRLGARGS